MELGLPLFVIPDDALLMISFFRLTDICELDELLAVVDRTLLTTRWRWDGISAVLLRLGALPRTGVSGLALLATDTYSWALGGLVLLAG